MQLGDKFYLANMHTTEFNNLCFRFANAKTPEAAQEAGQKLQEYLQGPNAFSDPNEEQFAEIAAQFVNCHRNEKRFIDALYRQHRTLQAGIFALACRIVKAIAALPRDFVDGRNQGAKYVAQTVSDACKKEGVSLDIPLV